MDYTTLYTIYNEELRPLVSEFEGREEQFEEPVLKSMAYLVDELSLCVQNGNVDKQKYHYDKAQQHLEEAVTNSYKYLVYSYHKRLKRFRRRFSKHQLELFDNGKFIGKFNASSKKAQSNVQCACKQNDLLNTKKYFKQAYECYSNLEYEISKFESEGAALQSRGKSIVCTIIKMVLSIAVSVCIAFFSKYIL